MVSLYQNITDDITPLLTTLAGTSMTGVFSIIGVTPNDGSVVPKVGDPYFDASAVLIRAEGADGAASIADATGKNTIITSGTAKLSTATAPYGTSALRLDGTTNCYVYTPNQAALNFGYNDFTIEWEMYCDVDWTSMTSPGVVGQKYGDAYNGWQIYRDGLLDPTTVNMRLAGTNNFSAKATPITQVWEHWAVTRSSGTLRWFKNGQQTASYPCNLNIGETSGTFYVGRSQTWNGYFNGRIKDLRITPGLARYTTNFTPPGWADISQPFNSKLRVQALPANATYQGTKDFYFNRIDLSKLPTLMPSFYRVPAQPGVSVLTILSKIKDQTGIRFDPTDLVDATTVQEADGSVSAILTAAANSYSFINSAKIYFAGAPNISAALMGEVLASF